MSPRVTDDDKGEITITLDGRGLRGWSYASEDERRQKMLMAREYVEGWGDGSGAVEETRRKLEYAYRVIHGGFTFGTFDFSILKTEAAQFVASADREAA